jgi:hypothetical protein
MDWPKVSFAYSSGEGDGLLLAHGDYYLPSWRLEKGESGQHFCGLNTPVVSQELESSDSKTGKLSSVLRRHYYEKLHYRYR